MVELNETSTSTTKKDHYKALDIRMKVIGESFRACQQAIEFAKLWGYDYSQNEKLKNDEMYVLTIEKILEYCSGTTACIIRHEYLEIHESYWYIEFFKSSNYYILRRKALDEFMSCLKNIERI